MICKKIPLLSSQSFSSLITDFLEHNERVEPFAGIFPDPQNILSSAQGLVFANEKRSVLVEVLRQQYHGLPIHESVQNNIEALALEHTFTVTTGHQLCLLTGPAYMVYKILSTIKLARLLQDDTTAKQIIPVFWMATEDHDFEEINHVHLFGEKISWTNEEGGAVGRLSTQNMQDALSQFTHLAGTSEEATALTSLVQKAYAQPTLTHATRYLLNELFGKYGLLIIDADNKELKSYFAPIALDELQHNTTKKIVDTTNGALKKSGYHPQVNPREINLFYLNNHVRARIERTAEGEWSVHGGDISWNWEQLKNMVEHQPEQISPNVLLRPMYQQMILPNLAYVGGPGELAYWLQLRSLFNHYEVHYPALVMRDSAVFITPKNVKRLAKLNLSYSDLLQPKDQLIKHLIGADQPILDEEKKQLQQWFEVVVTKAAQTDVTLESAARAELQKWLSGMDVLQKRMIKAIKQKEEQKIAQLESLLSELFPEGQGQERHDNFFQFQLSTRAMLLDVLLQAFDPLRQEMKIFELS